MKPVLRGIDLNVPAGQSVALFGPNGAGKTTLIRIIVGLSKHTSGSVKLGGQEVQQAGHGLRRHIGFVGHNPLVYDSLTAEENLIFFGRLYETPDLPQRIDEVLQRVGLHHRRKDLVRTYSRGMIQRLAIARAIVHDPPILLLDEPDTGLPAGSGHVARPADGYRRQRPHGVADHPQPGARHRVGRPGADSQRRQVYTNVMDETSRPVKAVAR